MPINPISAIDNVAFNRASIEINNREDTVPAWWKKLFGFDLAKRVGDLDTDGDGRTNFMEFLEGTDPLLIDEPKLAISWKEAAQNIGGKVKGILVAALAPLSPGFSGAKIFNNIAPSEG